MAPRVTLTLGERMARLETLIDDPDQGLKPAVVRVEQKVDLLLSERAGRRPLLGLSKYVASASVAGLVAWFVAHPVKLH